MPTTRRTLAGVAGLCALALAATTAPVTTAAAADDQDTRSRRAAQLRPGRPAAPPASAGERSRAVRIDAAGARRRTRRRPRSRLTLFDDTTVTAAIDGRDTVGGATSWTGALVGDVGTFTAAEVDGVGPPERRLRRARHLRGQPRPRRQLRGRPRSPRCRSRRRRGGARRRAPVHADRRRPPGPPGASGCRPRPEPDAAAPGARRRGRPVCRSTSRSSTPPTLPGTVRRRPTMQAQFALGIAQTNQAFAASGVRTQVRLVGTRQVAATQAVDADRPTTTRSRHPGDGVFDEAQALREETHADLVSLWLGGTYPAGSLAAAWARSAAPSRSTDAELRRVDRRSTATGAPRATSRFAHEIGHNLSADHDAGASRRRTGCKPYARGYVDLTAHIHHDHGLPRPVHPRPAHLHPHRATSPTPTSASTAGRPAPPADQQRAGRSPSRPPPSRATASRRSTPGAVVHRRSGALPRHGASRRSTPWAPAGQPWATSGSSTAYPSPGATASAVRLSRRDIGRHRSPCRSSAPRPTTPPSPRPRARRSWCGKALFTTSSGPSSRACRAPGACSRCRSRAGSPSRSRRASRCATSG